MYRMTKPTDYHARSVIRCDGRVHHRVDLPPDLFVKSSNFQTRTAVVFPIITSDKAPTLSQSTLDARRIDALRHDDRRGENHDDHHDS